MSISVTREKLRAAETLLRRAETRLGKAESHAASAARNMILASSAATIGCMAVLCASVANSDVLAQMFDENASYFIDVFAFLGVAFFLSAMGAGFEERRQAGAKVRGLQSEVDRRTREADALREVLEAEEADVALHGPPPTERQSLTAFIRHVSQDGAYSLSSQLSKAVACWSEREPGVSDADVWAALAEANRWSEMTTDRVRVAHSLYLESRAAELAVWSARRAPALA